MRKLKVLFLTSLMVILLISCAEKMPDRQEISQEMAAFDAYYISAFLASQKQNKSRFSQLKDMLSQKWKDLSAKLDLYLKNDDSWPTIKKDSSQSLEDSLKAAEKGQFLKAEKELEKISYALSKIRQEKQIEYYLDPLNQFNRVLQKIIAMTRALNTKDPNPMKIGKIQEASAKALADLKQLKLKDLDILTFDLKDNEKMALQKAKTQMQQDFERYLELLSAEDKTGIKESAKNLEDSLYRIYSVFAKS